MKKNKIKYAAVLCAAALLLSSCEYAETPGTDEAGHEHNVLHWEVVSAVGCESEGMRFGTCIDCTSEVRDEQKPLGHSYRNGVCARCGKEQNEKTGAEAIFHFERHGSKNGYVLTSVRNVESEHLEIPSEYEGLPVVAIGECALAANIDVQSVVIPDSVTEIRLSAFYGCTSLKSVVIPDSVTSIGANAFCACYNLRYVTMSKNLDTIDAYAFAECYDIREIVFSDKLKNISEYCFANCIMLEKVEAPACTTIGDYAFLQCKRLYSFDFPKTLKKICSGAFSYSSLAKVDLPEGMEAIEYDAFRGTYLSEVRVPNLKYDNLGAFTNCEKLETVIIGTDKINSELYGSENVKTIVFEEGVKKIEMYSVGVYEALEAIYLPKSLTLFEATLPNAVNLKKIVYAGTLSDWLALNRNYYWVFFPEGCVLECADVTLTPEELRAYETLD